MHTRCRKNYCAVIKEFNEVSNLSRGVSIEENPSWAMRLACQVLLAFAPALGSCTLLQPPFNCTTLFRGCKAPVGEVAIRFLGLGVQPQHPVWQPPRTGAALPWRFWLGIVRRCVPHVLGLVGTACTAMRQGGCRHHLVVVDVEEPASRRRSGCDVQLALSRRSA